MWEKDAGYDGADILDGIEHEVVGHLVITQLFAAEHSADDQIIRISGKIVHKSESSQIEAEFRNCQNVAFVEAKPRPPHGRAVFLLGCLDSTGRFVRGHSHFCAAGPKAYEARTGWALALLGQVGGGERYLDGARRIAAYAVSCQQPNGWFSENDIDNHDTPLTHTIGYVLEGLWETGLILQQDSLLDRTLSTLVRPHRPLDRR